MSWQDIGEVLIRVGFGRNSSRAYSRRDHHRDHDGIHHRHRHPTTPAASHPRSSRGCVEGGRYHTPMAVVVGDPDHPSSPSASAEQRHDQQPPALTESETSIHPPSSRVAAAHHAVGSDDEEVGNSNASEEGSGVGHERSISSEEGGSGAGEGSVQEEEEEVDVPIQGDDGRCGARENGLKEDAVPMQEYGRPEGSRGSSSCVAEEAEEGEVEEPEKGMEEDAKAQAGEEAEVRADAEMKEEAQAKAEEEAEAEVQREAAIEVEKVEEEDVEVETPPDHEEMTVPPKDFDHVTDEETNITESSWAAGRDVQVDRLVPPNLLEHPPSILAAATVSPVDALNSAADSIAVRSEVESVLMSMLADVEASHSLSAEVRQRSAVSQLRHELAVARRALEETRATNECEARRRAELGDRFVRELLGLSARLADSERWREDNEEKVRRYEDMRRELVLTRERVDVLEREMDRAMTFCEEGSSGVVGDDNDDACTELEACANDKEGATATTTTSPPVEREEPGATPGAATGTATTTTSPPVEREESKATPGATTGTTGEGSASQLAQTHQLEPLQMEEAAPSLETIPEPALMCIFSYLEAQDILLTAEVDVIMYSRVDSLFGLGDGGGVREGEEPAEDPAAKSDKSAFLVSDGLTVAESSPVASILSAAHVGQDALEGLSHVFSNIRTHATAPLQKDRRRHSVAGDGIASAETALKSLATDAASSPSIVLTSDMASNMAAKLAPSELAVIISMREKLRGRDNELFKLQQEREDAVAELQGIEAVKDFLVKKLREAERAKTAMEEDAIKTARQVASDQEIISFLDERVEELEQSVDTLETANGRAKEEIEMLQAKRCEKVRILEDMLQFERDQLASSQREWKTTKKVLVKEVKSCRKQILALEAERDGLEEQNAKLKDALLTGHVGNPISKDAR